MKDIVVIGGGPGGYVAAIRAAQLGMDVMLVERDRLGGTCLNKGCIPTKAYYKNAQLLGEMQRLEEFNLSPVSTDFDMAGAHARMRRISEQLVGGVEKLMEANGIQWRAGEGVLTDAHHVQIGEESIETKRVLLAMGSEPAWPPIEGLHLPGVVDSTGLLALTAAPKRLVVIGGGVIGMEFACIFRRFGAEVTVVEALPHILAGVDSDLIKRFAVMAKKQGITIRTDHRVQRIRRDEHGLCVEVTGKKGEQTLQADCVLVSVGRKPCHGGMDLQALGIACQHGAIVVDENYQTTLQDVYAIGDVIGGVMLAHVASEEGRVAVERMAGHTTEVAAVPSCIFTFPEIACVGLDEQAAKENHCLGATGRFLFGANGKALTLGEAEGMVKVIAAPDHRIIGVHIMGPHASDLILLATQWVQNGTTLEQAAEMVFPHPTLGETLHEAVLDALGRAVHAVSRKASR